MFSESIVGSKNKKSVQLLKEGLLNLKWKGEIIKLKLGSKLLDFVLWQGAIRFKRTAYTIVRAHFEPK